MKKSSIFVTMHIVGMRLICIHVPFLKCHNLHNFQLILVPVQRTAKTGFRIFLQTIDGAKFSSHDGGSHL